MNLKDKVIVITGGSKGFGKALATELLKEGSKVSICALNEIELNQVSEELGVLATVADVRNEQEMASLLEKTVEKYGNIDIWINNAGVWMGEDVAENFDMEKVRRMFEINVFGLMNGSRVALRHMKPKGSGTIVNILTRAALDGRPGISMYASSKWAALGFSKSIREENKNLTILDVFPGGMKTDIFGDYEYPDFDKFLDPSEVACKIVENLKKENPDTDLIIKRRT